MKNGSLSLLFLVWATSPNGKTKTAQFAHFLAGTTFTGVLQSFLKLGFVGLLFVLQTQAVVHAARFSAWVTHVSDGDTLWVQPQGEGPHDRIKIRIQGVDAPEICQAYGPQAQAALSQWVLHRTVSVQTSRRDVYGRWLARLWNDQGQDIAEQLVAGGYAWSYAYRRYESAYFAQQHEAQTGGRGLWAQGAVQEPRQFRRQHGPCE